MERLIILILCLVGFVPDLLNGQEKITSITEVGSSRYQLTSYFDNSFHIIDVGLKGKYSVLRLSEDLATSTIELEGTSGYDWAHYFVFKDHLIVVGDSSYTLINLISGQNTLIDLPQCIVADEDSKIVHTDDNSIILRLKNSCNNFATFLLIENDGQNKQIGNDGYFFVMKVGSNILFKSQNFGGDTNYQIQNIETMEFKSFTTKQEGPATIDAEFVYYLEDYNVLKKVRFGLSDLPINLPIDKNIVTDLHVSGELLYLIIVNHFYAEVVVYNLATNKVISERFFNFSMLTFTSVFDYEIDVSDDFIVVSSIIESFSFNMKTFDTNVFQRDNDFEEFYNEDEVIITKGNILISSNNDDVSVINLITGTESKVAIRPNLEFVSYAERDTSILINYSNPFFLTDLNSVNLINGKVSSIGTNLPSMLGLEKDSKLINVGSELILINNLDLYVIKDNIYAKLNINSISPNYALRVKEYEGTVYFIEDVGSLHKFYQYKDQKIELLFELNKLVEISFYKPFKNGLIIETDNSDFLTYSSTEKLLKFYETSDGGFLYEFALLSDAIFMRNENQIYIVKDDGAKLVKQNIRDFTLFSLNDEVYYFDGNMYKYSNLSNDFRKVTTVTEITSDFYYVNSYQLDNRILIELSNFPDEYYAFDGTNLSLISYDLDGSLFPYRDVNRIGNTSIFYKYGEKTYIFFDTEKNKSLVLELRAQEKLQDATIFQGDTLFYLRSIDPANAGIYKITNYFINKELIIPTPITNLSVGKQNSFFSYYDNLFFIGDQYLYQIDKSYDVSQIPNVDLMPLHSQGVINQGKYMYYFGYDEVESCQVFRTNLGKPLAVNDVNEIKKTFRLSPNPAHQNFTLNSIIINQDAFVRITNMSGETCWKGRHDKEMVFSANDFTNGVYIVQLIHGNTIIQSEKLVIVR